MTTKYSDIKTYDELLEELATSKDATIDALFELVELRAELATIKPKWDDAPEWADTVTAQWIWLDACHVPQNAKYVEIYRPEPAK